MPEIPLIDSRYAEILEECAASQFITHIDTSKENGLTTITAEYDFAGITGTVTAKHADFDQAAVCIILLLTKISCVSIG